MAQWTNFPWKDPVFANADESILRQAPAMAENVYANSSGGFSRFPGLRSFASLAGQGRVYLGSWRDMLVAVTDAGRVFRVGRNALPEDVTGVPVTGGGRPVLAATEDQLVVAAGGPLVSLANDRSQLLSDEAPDSTHVAFVDGYLVAIEAGTQFFRYCNPGAYRTWDVLNVFAAEGKPDNLVACAVTPYRELLLAGPDSIEQFERLQSGSRPFFRRWSTGEGLAQPYTLVTDTAGTYGVNDKAEFVRFSAQVSREQSNEVALPLEEVDDWTGAWAAAVNRKGQRWIVLQAPNATVEEAGATGLTLLLDVRRRRWSFLWGWDAAAGRVARWPGWSVAEVWGRTFVGVKDGIAELDAGAFDNLGSPMRALIRSAHVDEWGASRVDGVRLRLKRGVGEHDGHEPQMLLRMRRDGARWSEWARQGMGRPGAEETVVEFGGFGCADTWQMELACTDPVPFEFVRAQVRVERLSW
jgi:hypothetical protein